MIIGRDEAGDRVVSLGPSRRAALCGDLEAVLMISSACIVAEAAKWD